ncbi:MAG: ABC transporter permease [Proteobacteria bacterium]|nr:ABC transporter permease [Pseudomonadota bacterium]
MLSRIAAVARKELLDASRDRRTLLVALVSAAAAGPIFLMLIFNLIASQAEKSHDIKLPVIGAERAPALIDYLKRQQVTITAAPADFEKQIRGGDLDIVMTIDDGYADAVADGRPGIVRLTYDRSRDRAGATIAEVEDLLRTYNRQWGGERLMMRGLAPSVAAPVEVRGVNVATPRQSGALILFMIAYYGLFASVIGSLSFALEAAAGERERMSLEPLLMTPATPLEIAVGKWLAIATFNLLVVCVTLTGFYLTLAFAPLPPVGVPFLFSAFDALRFVLILLPMIALMPAVLLFLGSRGRSIREAQANTSLLFFVVSIIPMIQQFTQRKEPPWILDVPVSAQYTLLNRVLRGEPLHFMDLLQSYAAPLVLTAVALFAIARLWSRESTLAGKT